MHIYLARHGRSSYNDLGLCNADPNVDVYLTETGIHQAEKLADTLKQAAIEQIYVSELKRTQQTAKYVNHYHHVDVRTDQQLNDIRTGYEGKPAQAYYAALEAAADPWTARFNGGESWQDVQERVRPFLENIRAQPHDSVLIITSSVIVQIMYGLLTSLTNQRVLELQIGPGSCVEVDI